MVSYSVDWVWSRGPFMVGTSRSSTRAKIVVMDDDDDCLFDLIGDPQSLNYFLQGPGGKSDTDSKSSVKGVVTQLGEGSSDGLQLSSSLQFLDEDLETSSLPDISDDQHFDILQKSLQEANITEQTLAEEAYLDADIGSSQTFAQQQLHPPSATSFTPTSDSTNYSSQTLHPLGVTHLPVGASFASSTVGVQDFMQHVGISVPRQQMPNCNQLSGSGQIQLISPFNNQPSMMTINSIDGSPLIFKRTGQPRSTSMGGGVLVNRETTNGNSMYGSSDLSPGGQTMSVPLSSASFQTSLPLHNIIIQRGLEPNANKIPINIQTKSLQIDQHTAYNMNNTGIKQHHIQQGIPFASGNMPQSLTVCNQQSSGKIVPSESMSNTGSSIVIHSPMVQHQAHQNQFLIPTGMSATSSSPHHIQTINGQLMQTHPTHLVPTHVSTEHVMLNRNSSSMIQANHPYSGQMFSSQNASVQVISDQTYSGPGSQAVVNHGTSQIGGGHVTLHQASPTLIHASPNHGNVPQGSSDFITMSIGQPSVTGIQVSNRFSVVCTATEHSSGGNSVQTVASGVHLFGDQPAHQDRTQTSVSTSHCLPLPSSKSTNSFTDSTVAHQTYSCCQPQKNIMSQPLAVSLLQTQDGLRQPQLASHLCSPSCSAVHGSGCKMLHHRPGTALLQHERSCISSHLQPNTQVDEHLGGTKRPAATQLTKGAFLQQLKKDQARVEVPDKKKFSSLNDAFQKLLSYHVFQGSMPNKEDLEKVDNEFESVAAHLLQRTKAMLNKYRLLLLEDAMRVNPSAEMVMIDRMFNQEERAALTREKRLIIVDPDSYHADFCCASRFLQKPDKEIESSDQHHASRITSSSLSWTPQLQKEDSDASSSIELTNHDARRLVPNNIALLNKTKKIQAKYEKFWKGSKSDKLSCSLGIQNLNAPGEGSGHSKLSDCSPCSPESKTVSRRLKKLEEDTHSPLCGPVEINTELKCMHSLHSDISSEDLLARTVTSTKETQKDMLLNRSLEKTFKNMLGVKKNGRHSQVEIGCSSTDLECSHLLTLASHEHYQAKLIPDHSQDVAETDSVLEAAVNSILEC
ncbi:BRD4-interacting chromatin-remodeling complex-associated protein-like isoform X2 [Ambystoma mexicanum]|uniref:BRD4-interacting chromatin-remodeling complex-associated protein-like isoform X2 n=1 Tax=Ambystoma mexicanum TaxID=8296 RepID=UPI0037E8CE54